MRSPRNALAALAALLLTFAAGAAPAEARTDRERYSPFDEDGEALISYGIRTGAECGYSYRTGTAATYRCFAGSRIYDPCYADPLQDGRVLCVSSPWDRHGTLLRNAREQDYMGEPNGKRSQIWAVELASGARCTMMGGATKVYRGKRMNFACGRNRYLWGSPRRGRATWTIRMTRNTTGQGWKFVEIAVAWS